ncbi:MAG: hypothetical protein AB1641_11845 [Thermodesulfobacteriota bacterium]
MEDQGERDDLMRRMLAAVHKATAGDLTRTAGMWIIGQELGLDRRRTEDLAMILVAEGWVEIRSLSGALALTEEGLRLSGEPSDREAPPALALPVFLDRLESALPDLELETTIMADLRQDLATLQAQQKRSRPLPGVIEAALQALEAALAVSPAGTANELRAALAHLDRT